MKELITYRVSFKASSELRETSKYKHDEHENWEEEIDETQVPWNMIKSTTKLSPTNLRKREKEKLMLYKRYELDLLSVRKSVD